MRFFKCILLGVVLTGSLFAFEMCGEQYYLFKEPPKNSGWSSKEIVFFGENIIRFDKKKGDALCSIYTTKDKPSVIVRLRKSLITKSAILFPDTLEKTDFSSSELLLKNYNGKSSVKESAVKYVDYTDHFIAGEDKIYSQSVIYKGSDFLINGASEVVGGKLKNGYLGYIVIESSAFRSKLEKKKTSQALSGKHKESDFGVNWH